MQARRSKTAGLIATAIGMLVVPAIAVAATGLPVVDPTVPAGRDTEPVILTGQSFPAWSVPSNLTAKAPLTDRASCLNEGNDSCDHNHYADPELDTSGQQPSGTPTDRLLGYRWDADAGRFVQIPFQVDEVFTRYLSNNASGFSFYSGEDQHTTYAYDREGFRFTANEPGDPCGAVPAIDPASGSPQPGGEPTTPDPVEGLDHNDELVFMASDTGPAAPAGATLPKGIREGRAVTVTDPLTGNQSYAYVMIAGADGPAPAYDADDGYVQYRRDTGADTFEFSQSSYDGYGNAPKGPYCDKEGNLVTNPDGTPKIGQRRPGDYGTVNTDRYRFRYDGRWLMTDIRIADDDRDYGRDLVDRWKARAFQQDPSSETPCCGYEEEDTNWGGSTQLLGERWGPVRAMRETWGADSGTNVVRRETFYRDEVRQKNWLRVHVIPPLDGIYAQWDFNAGVAKTFYNPHHLEGIAIDGRNDEAFGNIDDPCNSKYDANDTSELDQTIRSAYGATPLCDISPYHQSVDVADPTLGSLNASLDWSQTSGPDGTIVDRYQIDKVTDLSAGGFAQSFAAVPYYRDDSCFDDGTGSDPGPRLRLRSSTETPTWEGTPRRCWDSSEGSGDPAVPGGDPRFYQGSIGTHGLHLLFLAETDNARLTVPTTEVVAEQRMVMLPGDRDATAGETYGRGFEKPLVATAADVNTLTYNLGPDARFSFQPSEPKTGEVVSFDASASSDPDGSIARYEWDLDGDGSFETDGGSSPTTSHSFADDGTYAVGLRVTDDGGGTDTATQEVTVANRPPVAAITFSPPSPKPRQTVTFDASGSTDPDGQIVAYRWDLDGDGSFETDTGSTPHANRAFDLPGGYTVSVRVTDDDGADSDAATRVTVASEQAKPKPKTKKSSKAKRKKLRR